MKDQPLPLNSVHFSLEFLTLLDRLSGQKCFALSSLYEKKIRIKKKSLKSS